MCNVICHTLSPGTLDTIQWMYARLAGWRSGIPVLYIVRERVPKKINICPFDKPGEQSIYQKLSFNFFCKLDIYLSSPHNKLVMCSQLLSQSCRENECIMASKLPITTSRLTYPCSMVTGVLLQQCIAMCKMSESGKMPFLWWVWKEIHLQRSSKSHVKLQH